MVSLRSSFSDFVAWFSRFPARIRMAQDIGIRTAFAPADSDAAVVRDIISVWDRALGPLVLIAPHHDLERWRKAIMRTKSMPRAVVLAGEAEEGAGLRDALLNRAPAGAVLDVAGGTPEALAARALELVVAASPRAPIMILADDIGDDTQSWTQGLLRVADDETRSAIERSAGRALSAEVSVARRTVTINVRQPHYVGVGEIDAERRLLLRTPRLQVNVLQSLDPATIHARARMIWHDRHNEIPEGFEQVMHAPRMHVREYIGPMRWYSHMLLAHGQTLLPPSFRFAHSTALDNPMTTMPARGVYHLKPSENVRRSESSPLYDLSGGWPSHYGHFISQSLAKLWGWEEAKSRYPDLKAAVQVVNSQHHPFEEALLNAYGVDSADILWVDEPIRVRHMISASLLYQVRPPGFVHPNMTQIWKRISRNLVVPDATTPKKLFVSRTATYGLRTCRNQLEVEEFFRDAGFSIYYPEQHTVAEQATAFHGADTIAGFGGSAMFNLMHVSNLKTLIILSHESYTATNEYLLSVDLDCDIHYFWSDPDIPRASDVPWETTFHSAWEFDFRRNRAALNELLDNL